MTATVHTQTVMVVDDTPLNIQILSGILGAEYDIRFATGAGEFFEMIGKVAPDLILLDVMMPDIDGYEVCRRLKEDPLLREIPVIFITALSQKGDEIVGLQAGAVDYITKPFTPEIVKLRVKNHLELKAYRDAYARMALVDGLTGIPNRRAFDEQLHREWLRAERSQIRLSLIMIDIDFFKQYNDIHGHLLGDTCLCRVASAILKSLRSSDFVARYGGEEFVCILPESDPNGTLLIAERIRESIASMQLPHGASLVSPHVTVSIGAATITPDQGQGAHTLVDMADKMLYKAKTRGRNRIEQWKTHG